MLKIFAPFIIAISLLIIVDSAISFTPVSDFLDERVQNVLQKKLEELKSDEKLDLLFIGTSRTNDGFATEFLENAIPDHHVNAYNLGLPTGDYYLFTLTLDNLVKKGVKPKLVLVEVANVLFKHNTIATNNILYFRTLIQNDQNLPLVLLNSSLLTLDEKKEIALTYISGIYRYRSIIGVGSIFKMINKHLKGESTSEISSQQGWHPQPVPKMMNNPNLITEKSEFTLSRLLVGYDEIKSSKLDYFLNYCKENNINVVLVQWPTHPVYDSYFNKSDISRLYYQEITRVSNKYNVPFLNLASELPEDHRGLFSEPSHLSRDGAILFTRRLAKKIFILEETRNYLNSQPGTPSRVLKKAHDER